MYVPALAAYCTSSRAINMAVWQRRGGRRKKTPHNWSCCVHCLVRHFSPSGARLLSYCIVNIPNEPMLSFEKRETQKASSSWWRMDETDKISVRTRHLSNVLTEHYSPNVASALLWNHSGLTIFPRASSKHLIYIDIHTAPLCKHESAKTVLFLRLRSRASS